MVHNMSPLLGGLRFHYDDFKASSINTARLGAVMDRALAEGHLTKERKRSRAWVGVVIVRKLLTAYLNDAHTNGCRSWDTILSRALCILLCSAMHVRTGDITKAHLDEHPLPFLCWDDVTMKLVDGEQLENLEARVLIRNEKMHK